ncbi:MAG: hypothetical protein OHK0022_30130 [Roseiflexaceae bacterium]
MTTLESLPPKTNNYSHIEQQAREYSGSFRLPVSVVIPFYKNTAVLSKTIASLINQTYPPNLIEVIISDDGSPESLDELFVHFGQQLNLKHVRQEDLGFRPASARNLGINHASGEIVVSIDFDMICPPKFVESHLRWFHVSDRVSTVGMRKFVNTSQITVDDVISHFDKITNLPPQRSISALTPTRNYDSRIRAFDNFKHFQFPAYYYYSCNIAYRRGQALEIGGFDEDFDYNYGWEDVDFGHRLWLAGVFLVAVEEATAYHQENETVTLDRKLQEDPVNRLKFYKKFPELKPAVLKRRKW